MTTWTTREEVDIPDTNKTLVLQHTEEDGGRENVYSVFFRVDAGNYNVTQDQYTWWGDKALEWSYKEFNKRLEEKGVDVQVQP